MYTRADELLLQDYVNDKPTEESIFLFLQNMHSKYRSLGYSYSFISILQKLLKYELIRKDVTQNNVKTLLHGLNNALLNNKISINDIQQMQIAKCYSTDKKDRTLLEYAVIKGQIETVTRLLDMGTHPDKMEDKSEDKAEEKEHYTPLMLSVITSQDKPASYGRYVNIITFAEYNNAMHDYSPWNENKHKYLKDKIPLVIVYQNNRSGEIYRIIGEDEEEKALPIQVHGSRVIAPAEPFENYIRDNFHQGHRKILISPDEPKLQWLLLAKPKGFGHVPCDKTIKELITTLIQHGADVGMQDQKGFTALMLAVYCGDHDLSILKTMLMELEKQITANKITPHKYKEIINKQNESGRTVIMHSLLAMDIEDKKNIKDIATTLVKNGADTGLQDNNGETALMHAVYCNDGDLSVLEAMLDELEKKVAANELKRDELKKILNKQDNNRYTVVMHMMINKKVKNRSRLLEKILKACDGDLTILSAVSKQGDTALDFANSLAKDNYGGILDMKDYMGARHLLNHKTPPSEKKQKIIALKEAGHVMGFADDLTRDAIMLDINEKEIEAAAAGFNDEYTFPLMTEVLNTFVNNERKEEKRAESNELLKDFEKIQAAFAATTELYNLNVSDGSEFLSPLFNRYKQNEMTPIPAGWTGHSITLVLYQDKIVVSNRGQYKHLDGGVNIFPIDRSKLETAEKFTRFVNSVQEGTYNSVMNAIEDILLPTPPAEFKPHFIEVTDTLPTAEKNKYFYNFRGLKQPRKDKVPLLALEGKEPNRKLTFYYRHFRPDTFNYAEDNHVFNMEEYGKFEISEKSSAIAFQKWLNLFRNPTSEDAVVKEIQSELAKRAHNPLASFPSKGQQHGTCSFVNKKSAIEGMLYLLKLERENNQQKSMQYSRDTYKYFTHKMRDQRADKILRHLREGLIRNNKDQVKTNLLLLEKALSLQPEQNKQWKYYENLQAVRLARQLRIRGKMIALYYDHPNNEFLKNFVEQQLSEFEKKCKATYDDAAYKLKGLKEQTRPLDDYDKKIKQKCADVSILLEREKVLAPVMKSIDECMNHLNNQIHFVESKKTPSPDELIMRAKLMSAKNRLAFIMEEMQKFPDLSSRLSYLKTAFSSKRNENSNSLFKAAGIAGWFSSNPYIKHIKDAVKAVHLEFNNIDMSHHINSQQSSRFKL